MAASSNLTVEVVSPEKRVWSGEATMVSARTLEGDIGILPDHAPLLGVLVDGTVTIKAAAGTSHDFQISGGFISVSKNRVSVLGEEQAS
jgi:F-type H+-transporting ATPase subunit epsilon